MGPHIKLSSIVHFDEMQKKCVIEISGEKNETKFPRDLNVHVDLNDAVYDDEMRNKLYFRYQKQLQI